MWNKYNPLLATQHKFYIICHNLFRKTGCFLGYVLLNIDKMLQNFNVEILQKCFFSFDVLK